MTQTISFVERLNGKMQSTSYSEINRLLKSKLNEKRKRGLSLYEYFDMSKNDFKIFFDIDRYDEDENIVEDEFRDAVCELLCRIFSVSQNDIAISSDNRMVVKQGKEIWKLSYHFVIDEKISYTGFKKIQPYLEHAFSKLGLEFDGSVYRNGLTKFRTLWSKKDDDKDSLLIPYNLKQLKCHLIQYIDGVNNCDTNKVIKWFNDNLDVEEKKVISYNIEETLDDIVAKFDTFGETKRGNATFYNLKKYHCPWADRIHKSNNCYLVRFEGTLLLKCHDEDCVGKCKVIHKIINEETNEFDFDVFNNMGLKDDEDNNYVRKKKYFENYYKYFRDLDGLNRIQMKYNKRFEYYERELIEVKERGIRDLKYEIKEEGKIIKKRFIDTYMNDCNKTNLFNIVFDPDNQKVKDYYNLFQGFQYESVLGTEDEITETDQELFQWWLDYIKKYVCEGKQEWFNYFMAHFALIVQQPTYLNHIIYIFYSKEHGVGKSNFFKFLGRVIGQKYTYFSSLEQICSTHSRAHVGTFINIIEEVDFYKASKMESELKDFSQRERALFNGKNKSEFMVDTFVRYFLTSNNEKNVKIDSQDRRYVVWQFQKILDMIYVDKLDEFYKNKKMLFLFGDYLANFEIPFKSRKQWINNRPKTEAYKKMVNNDSVKSFVDKLYNCESIFESDEEMKEAIIARLKKNIIKIKLGTFYSYYKMYCIKSNMRPFAEDNFKNAIMERYNSIEWKKTGTWFFFVDLKMLNYEQEYEEKYINHYTD